MKKTIIKSFALSALALAGMLTSCSDFKPEMTPDVPNLPTVTNLKSDVSDRVVTISWAYPSTSLEIDGVNVIVNNNTDYPVQLDKGATSYSVKGQPMETEYMYTVKVRYKSGSSNYMSEGQTTYATVPYEQLANLTSFQISGVEGRAVTFSWSYPSAAGITGVRIGIDGQDSWTTFDAGSTSGTLKGQPTGQDLKYRAQVIYDEAYYSDGVVVDTNLPEIETRTGFLLLANSPADLPDDDEVAAAAWYYDNYVSTNKGDFIKVEDLATIDYDLYGVIWIMVDRKGLERGWENLPSELVSSSTIEALKAYTANGGSFYLSNMATQLTVPLGIVPENMPINTFASGDGGWGDDVWTINPYLGWDFQGTDNFYDRTSHAVYAGITMEDPNGYGYVSVPLIGPGEREDHNSMWDLNPYWGEAGNPAPNCVKWFENATNSLVLATWGHVRDHCVAGMVDFSANAIHGRCIANGFAAYEWNQNSGPNPYQQNVEKLTENILNYLK